MNALACLAEAFAWLFRPGIRRFILLPLAVNITLFAVGSYAAFHYGDALVALRHALASGADPVPLVAAIASKLRTMARVAGIRESSASLAARLGMKDWQVDRARRDLRQRMSPDEIGDAGEYAGVEP